MVDLSKYEDHDIAREPEDDVPQLFMGDNTLPAVILDFEEDGNA
jgi:hypothetical protein